MKLIDLVKDNRAYFDYFRQGMAYYHINFYKRLDKAEQMEGKLNPEWGTYRFAVPLEDVGNGTLNVNEKAITLMRWIRKAKESKELVKIL